MQRKRESYQIFYAGAEIGYAHTYGVNSKVESKGAPLFVNITKFL